MNASNATALVLVALAALGAAGTAFAQTYPTKPVTIKVAYPAGGPADAAARQMQVQFQAALGQPAIVENVPGAGGSIGVNQVLNAPADGHTLLVITGNDAILAPLSLASAKYKAEDLRIVYPLIVSEFFLASNTNHSFDSADAFIEFARRPGQKELSFGTWGHGSAPHLVGADFKEQTGARFLDVPYKGVAPVVQDLLGNQVDMAFLPLAGNIQGLVQTGKIRAVGLASVKRNPNLPNIPTVNEGRHLKSFVYTVWPAVFVSSKTPDALVTRLHQLVSEVVNSAAFQKYSRETGNLPLEPMALPQAAGFYKSEIDKYTRVARSIKLVPQ